MPFQSRVVVLDDDRTRARSLVELLAAAGHDARELSPAETPPTSDVVLLASEGVDADTVARLAASLPDAELLLLVDSRLRVPEIAARGGGAPEVVERVAGSDALLAAVERAARVGSDRREIAALRARVGDEARRALVGQSSGIERVRELIGRAAGSRRTVLVTGEAGAGKSTVARLVHDLSDRAGRPFMVARCEGADADSLEAELFGGPRVGLLERARGGTLVLEEARALPRALHGRLAAMMAPQSVPQPRAPVVRPVDVRMVLTVRTTDREADVASPFLDESMMLRIPVPPLRERRRDIPLLVQHFRDRLAEEGRASLRSIGPDTITPLLAHDWPGNVRELAHWVDRISLANGAAQAAPPPRHMTSFAASFAPFDSARLTLAALERHYILHVLTQEGGHQSRAAVRLGIDRRTLYRKLKEYRDEDDDVRIAG